MLTATVRISTRWHGSPYRLSRRGKSKVSKPTPLSLDKLQRLMADLEAGLYDGRPRAPIQKAPSAAPQRFADLKPFDVKAWAERKRLKLRDASAAPVAKRRGPSK